MPIRLRTLLLILVLAIATLLRAHDLRAPFDRGFEGFQGGAWAIAARHRLEHGSERVGIFPVLNPSLPDAFRAEQLFVYTNHPLATHSVDVAMAHLLGMQEWALRLPYLLGSLATVLLIYVLGLRVLGPLGALLAATLAATSPGLAFFGAIMNYEDLCIPAMLLAVWAHLRWTEAGRIRDAALFALALCFAVSIDWPAAFLAPGFVLERLLRRGNLSWLKRARAALFCGLVSAVAIASAVTAHLVLVRWNYELLGLAQPQAAGLAGAADRLVVMAEPFTNGALAGWLEAQAEHVRQMVRFDLALLALIGIALCWMPERRCERARVVILPGVIAGLLYVLCFAKHALDQSLFWMYSLPFFCLASGFALSRASALVGARAFSRRAAGLALALPAGLLGVMQWKELRDRDRSDVRTAEIGLAIKAATPELTNLYVPSSAGWNMAYAYYSRHLYTSIDPEDVALIAPVDALRDLDIAPAARRKASEHVFFLLTKGLTDARHALVIDERAHPTQQRDQRQLERALRRIAEVEEQRLDDGLRLLWVKPQDYWGEGMRRVLLHDSAPERTAILGKISALRAAAPDARVIYTSERSELGLGEGPLLAAGTLIYVLEPDPTVADRWLAPIAGSNHARRLEALGNPARAIVLLPEEHRFAAALRAAKPSLAPFSAVQGRLVCPLPPLTAAPPRPAPPPH